MQHMIDSLANNELEKKQIENHSSTHKQKNFDRHQKRMLAAWVTQFKTFNQHLFFNLRWIKQFTIDITEEYYYLGISF